MTNSSTVSFHVAWRYQLPNVIKWGMNLQNFNLGGYNLLLSFKAELENITVSGSDIYLECFSTYSEILFINFGILVVTEDNSIIELINYGKYLLK